MGEHSPSPHRQGWVVSGWVTRPPTLREHRHNIKKIVALLLVTVLLAFGRQSVSPATTETVAILARPLSGCPLWAVVKGFFIIDGVAERKTIDTINLQNFERARYILMKIKKILPEKNPPETRTTLREQVSYIWITFRELLSYIK